MHERVEIEICEEPVFIIGSPRSGTSVLAWSLVEHGDFWTTTETDFLLWLFGRGHLRQAVGRIAGHQAGGWLAQRGLEPADLVAAIGLGVNSLISSQSEGRRWVDQTPSYTLMASDLAELFPGARFLHIVRDGRSVVHSMINSGFAEPWATDFTSACRTWVGFVETATRFEQDHPGRCLTVRYAGLVADPVATFEEIHDFVHAPRRPGSAEFFSTTRINSSFQQPDRPDSYVAPPDPWTSWSRDQRSTFLRQAGPTMEMLGLAHELHARV